MEIEHSKPDLLHIIQYQAKVIQKLLDMLDRETGAGKGKILAAATIEILKDSGQWQEPEKTEISGKMEATVTCTMKPVRKHPWLN